jgi:phytoene dehydrogenase-like protein
MKPVAIVGGGLAGLACARRLEELRVPFALFEASGRLGGRVATDVVDGHRVDRGFQVLLDSYPEARAVLDLRTLVTRRFAAGALVRRRGSTWRVVDPWRSPLGAIGTLRAPFVGLRDALAMAGRSSSAGDSRPSWCPPSCARSSPA